MNNSIISKKDTGLYFFIAFLSFYFIVWGILPAIIYNSVYLDSAENLALSHTLSWSYSKHPPLGMFFLHYSQLILKNNELTVFISSALCFTVSFLYLYKITRMFLTKKNTIASILISSLSYYCVLIFVLQYNQNTILLPFWVASIYHFLRAIEHNKISSWIYLSLVCALGMLAKYEMLLIIGVELIYLCYIFKKNYLPKLILAATLSATLLAPHFLWLYNHNFYPIQYFLEKSQHASNLFIHIKTFFSALVLQPLNLLLCFIVLFYLRRQRKYIIQHAALNVSIKNPLVFISIMPWIIFCILSLFIRTHAEWGFPLFTLLIPALFHAYKIEFKDLSTLFKIVVFMHCIIFLTFFITLKFGNKVHAMNRPSYQLANIANKFWNQHYPQKKIKYIGGDPMWVYYLTAYLPSNPAVFMHNSFKQSPWVNKKDFEKNGALFINKGCQRTPTTLYQNSKFKVREQMCITVNASNKFQKLAIPYTLYIIPPQTVTG